MIDRLAVLPPEKRALLALRLKQQGIMLPPDFIPPAQARDNAFPLSFAQERLWFFDHLVPGSPLYNLPVALRLEGSLRFPVLQCSLDALLRRHEALRLRFSDSAGTIVQHPEPPAAARVQLIDLRQLAPDIRAATAADLTTAAARRTFDLRNGPLITFDLLRLGEAEHLLLLVVHHIVADGWSAGIFIRDLATLYTAYAADQAPLLPEPPIRFVDYVVWQRERMAGPEHAAGYQFWQERLAGAATVLELPTDRPRPAVQTFRGDTALALVPLPLAQAVQAQCKQAGVTLFMGLVAAYQALLARYTGQQDILIGSPVAGRNQRETSGLIGFFVNTVVLRTSLAGNPSVQELLARVRTTVLEALAHQDMPFEQLLGYIKPDRSLSHTPIFQVAFVLQNSPMQPLSLPGLQITPLESNSGVAKFDLHLDITETSAGLKLAIEYNTDLFNHATIQSMLGHYVRMLEGFVADPEQRVATIDLLGTAERTLLLETWNATARPYPHQPIHQLVIEQALRTPTAVAVVAGAQQRSYADLLRNASRLARLLAAQGVRRGDRIGVYLERGIPLIEVLLGTLMADAAYVPLDPSYPGERIGLMVEDAGLALVLTDSRLVAQLPSLQIPVLALDAMAEALAGHLDTPPPTLARLDDLAYCMYTSGSTGRPKGVNIPHRAIVRLVRDTNYVALSSADCIAQAANVSFDAATFEIWGALANGARLLLISREALLAPHELAELLRRERVSTIFLTTALFNQIARIEPTAFAGLRQVLFGGEAVDPDCVRQVLAAGPPERLLHVYGPTENTTFSTWHHVGAVDGAATTVPIGQPLANDRAYVLDPGDPLGGQPVPVGVPGELYVGG
ncbi:MAG: AMP-binding protein, partial [Herpetosiphonaceae bacterium]|nr:AMP-binding protein [Herpetosiphonaceae bacterium]